MENDQDLLTTLAQHDAIESVAPGALDILGKMYSLVIGVGFVFITGIFCYTMLKSIIVQILTGEL